MRLPGRKQGSTLPAITDGTERSTSDAAVDPADETAAAGAGPSDSAGNPVDEGAAASAGSSASRSRLRPRRGRTGRRGATDETPEVSSVAVGTTADGSPADGSAADGSEAGVSTSEKPKVPLYPRLLRLRHVKPNAWQRAALGEGALGVAVLLVLADLATAWTLLALPVAVAVVVKAHDGLAGLLQGPSAAGPPDRSTGT